MDTHHTLTDLVCDEARAFEARHPDLQGAARSTGMLTWGLLRALLACDCAPGAFRVPQDAAWQMLVCPACHGVWTWTPKGDEPPTMPRSRRKR